MLSLSSFTLLAAGLSTLLPCAIASDPAAVAQPRHTKGSRSPAFNSASVHAGQRSSSRRHHVRRAAKRNFGGVAPADVEAQSPNNGTSPINKRALLSGTGFGTLYYDMNGGGTCGAVNGWSSFPETNGYAMCEPNAGYKTLAQRGSNRIVAMPSEMLSGHLADYCGKEVKVTYKGRTVENLVIWDGCAACNGADGLDFSSSVFAEVFGADNCDKGKIYDMSWEITGNQLWAYPSGDVLSGGGSDNSGGSDSSSTWTPEKSSSSTPPAAAPTKPWSSSSSWSKPTVTKSVANGQGAIKPHDSGVFSSRTQQQFVVASTATWSSSAEEEAPASTLTTTDAPASSSSSTTTSTFSRAANPKTITRALQSKPTDNSSSSSEDDSALTSRVVPVPAPTSGSSDGKACNDTPGAWVCSGNTLQQCIQTVGDWVWLTRVECNVAPINCDSPNPVCPSIASRI